MGRSSRPPFTCEKRLCHSCKLLIENKKHFVLYCPSYDQCRLQYCNILIAQYYMNGNLIIDITCINPPNIKITRRVCNFLKKCYDIRKEKN